MKTDDNNKKGETKLNKCEEITQSPIDDNNKEQKIKLDKLEEITNKEQKIKLDKLEEITQSPIEHRKESRKNDRLKTLRIFLFGAGIFYVILSIVIILMMFCDKYKTTP